MFSIRVTGPDGKSRTYPFPGTQCSIGRDAANDIVLEGTAVSGRHCMLELTGTTCTLKERGSTTARGSTTTASTSPRRSRSPMDLRRQLSGRAHTHGPRGRASRPQHRGAAAARSDPQNPGPDRDWRELHARFTRYARSGTSPSVRPTSPCRRRRWDALGVGCDRPGPICTRPSPRCSAVLRGEQKGPERTDDQAGRPRRRGGCSCSPRESPWPC